MTVGIQLGEMLGLTDGDEEGVCDGCKEGTFVGDTVGNALVGDSVGDAVVGDSVGPMGSAALQLTLNALINTLALNEP